MFKAIMCILALTAGNFTYQNFFADVPNYDIALHESFEQAIAILIYHFMFVKSESDNA
jgi:hypothetical protein